MISHYQIDAPAVISFSGGRTSGFMLKHILDAHAGELPEDVLVLFMNTGKEMPQTLDFVRDCGEHWGVKIVWLEYRWAPGWQGYAVVDYETASRNGEPFDALIRKKEYLPNPVMRFCTGELKINTMRRYARARGLDDWSNWIGLRADEPRRVGRARSQSATGKDGWVVEMPLAAAGITKGDVGAWWKQRNFDLALPNINGVTPAGNCDLCFLKSAKTISGIMRARPELADWWIAAEAQKRASKSAGALFRTDRPEYAKLLDAVERQAAFDFGDSDYIGECFCHD